MNAPFHPDVPVLTPQSSPVLFVGRRLQFLKLLITGGLMQFPTLGFYRFWLVTRMRRHLWANTQIDGEAFEYTGTAKELLIGFLIALAVLAPIYFASFLLGVFLEEWNALGSIPLFIVFYAFGHFGFYRARRYRATRTVFRGLRFWMTGRGWSYAAQAILWDVVKLLTLGLAVPWAMASLERYRMQNTYFGSVRGDFTGTGWTLFKRGIWVWMLGLAVAASIIVAMRFTSPTLLYLYYRFTPLVYFIAIIIPAILLWPLALAIFTRWQIEGIRFGEVSLSCDLGKGAFYGAFIKLIASSCGLLVFLIGLVVLTDLQAPAFAREAGEAIQAGNLNRDAWIMLSLIVLGYLTLFLGIGVLQRYFMSRGLWAITAQSTAVANLTAIDTAVAAGQPAGVVGEGLADALDFNVGI